MRGSTTSIPHLILAAGFASLPVATLSAQDSNLPALESFFAESTRFAERLSPDGKQVAYLGPDSRGINRLWVVSPDAPDSPKQISPPGESAVAVFFWIGNDSLLWQTNGPDGQPRLFLGDSQGITTRRILANEHRVICLQGVANSSEPCVLGSEDFGQQNAP